MSRNFTEATDCVYNITSTTRGVIVILFRTPDDLSSPLSAPTASTRGAETVFDGGEDTILYCYESVNIILIIIVIGAVRPESSLFSRLVIKRFFFLNVNIKLPDTIASIPAVHTVVDQTTS